jgi:ribonuclease HI
MEKTEILPIGTKTHRERVIEQRKINPLDEPWHTSVRVAKDGHPIRTLGAWIGNDIEHTTSWEPILEKIDKNLIRWGQCHPSLDGKRLIVQMVVGGMTQFLTKAQGMPSSIETAIKKKIRTFMWDGRKSPPISLTRLEQPVDKGGLNLLNIEARNKAIEITWVKAYMDMTLSRPAWAFVTDVIINTLKPNGIRSQDDIASFLTSWDPPTQGKRVNRLPNTIINLMKTTRKYNVSFAPIKLSDSLKAQLPAWLHLGAPPKTYHKTKNKCLQTNHRVNSVKDLKETSNRLTNTDIHQTIASCACDECVENRLAGCKNPDKCARVARQILDNLTPLFNPNTSPLKDNLTLTHRRLEKNSRSRTQRDGEILFDPSITTKNHISECFRIFVDPERLIQIPAYRLRTPTTGRGVETEPITVYTDGSCKDNGKYNATCGSGIWVSEDNPVNKVIRVPGDKQSNQIGELAAVLVTLQTINPITPIKIITDSKYVIQGITTHLKTWEDTGWIGIDNAEMFKAIAYQLRRRPSPTTFKWIKGHQGHIGNEKADRLALTGALRSDPDNINTYVPRNFDIQGAKLSEITQKLAYAEIMSKTHLDYHRTTLSLLDVTRYAVESLSSSLETDGAIWRGCRHHQGINPKLI